MIIKRISCQVKEEEADTFSNIQAQWQSLSKINGFLGQIGGWDRKNQYTACIFSFWENKAAYDYFMNNVHDNIFLNSNQSKTYSSIEVELFEEKFGIEGLERDIVSVLRASRFIRTALSDVKEDRISHFLDMQSQVWNPGMKQTNHLLGGEFGSSLQDHRRFLVLTGWLSEETHENYMNVYFPKLNAAANPERDLNNISGQRFAIENSWRVFRQRT